MYIYFMCDYCTILSVSYSTNTILKLKNLRVLFYQLLMCMLEERNIYIQDSFEYEVVNGFGCIETIYRKILNCDLFPYSCPVKTL